MRDLRKYKVRIPLKDFGDIVTGDKTWYDYTPLAKYTSLIYNLTLAQLAMSHALKGMKGIK